MRITGSRKTGILAGTAVAVAMLAVGWQITGQQEERHYLAEARMALAEMDMDQDGAISQGEFMDFLKSEETLMREEYMMDVDYGTAEKSVAVPGNCQEEFDQALGLNTDEAEWRAEFKKMDLDANGRLESNELSIALRQDREEEFRELDKNQDGHLTRAELTDGMMAYDTVAFSTECEEALTASEENGLAPIEEEEEIEDARDLAVLFSGLDSNQDKQISREEFLNSPF